MRVGPSLALMVVSCLVVFPVTPSAAKPDAVDDDGGDYTVWVTPHDSYSSSVGVLGCKIDTDRVAYWPAAVDCDNICVSLSCEGRDLKLLRIDQSQGAYDVSYDAWNYLVTGESALDAPTAGGAVEMHAKDLDASECEKLIKTDGRKLPLSAANSMNFLANCLGEGSHSDEDGEEEGGEGGSGGSGTWVGRNYRLYNIADAICSLGHDEECDLDWPEANQADCPSGLGDMPKLTDAPVYNIRYPGGEKVLASTGEEVDADSAAHSWRMRSRRRRRGGPTDWALPWLLLTIGVAVGTFW